MSGNLYKPYSDVSHQNAKAPRTKPPFLRAMIALIIANTCLGAAFVFLQTPPGAWDSPGQQIILLVAIFFYAMMFLGAYLLHRCNRYAYIPLLIHSVYAIIIYATTFSDIKDIAIAVMQHIDMIGSNAQVDYAAEYVLLCAYGFLMCFVYVGYSVYWRKKGLLT